MFLFVRSLGATPIDYTAGPFEQAVGDIDLVIDPLAGESQVRAWHTLKPDGALISVVAPPSDPTGSRRTGMVIVQQCTHKAAQLAEIGALLAAGTVQVVIRRGAAVQPGASRAHQKRGRPRARQDHPRFATSAGTTRCWRIIKASGTQEYLKGVGPMAQTYMVRAGDSLWSIAQQLYGDGNQWNTIYEANRTVLSDPNVIQDGWTLTIPAAPAPPQPGQTYMTTDSDTLWDIAARFYGDGTQWPKIYAANQAAVGADPNVLTGGITLTIPA